MSRSLRFALVFVIAALGFLAGLQVIGRIFSTNLSDLEPSINELLVSYDVSLEGAAGGWSRLNPTFTARSITFAGGRLDEVFFEINFLKSLLYNRVVVSRLVVGSAYIGLERMGPEWQVLGVGRTGQPTLDIFGVLIDSEDISVSVELEAFRYGKSTSFIIGARSLNLDGRRRISLTVGPGKSCERCGGRLELDLSDSFWGRSSGDGLGFVELRDVTFNDKVAEIFGVPVGKLNVTGGWEKSSKGEVFSVEALFEGGQDDDSRFVASANLTGGLQGDGYRGFINNVRLDSVAGRVELSPFNIVTDARDRLELFSPTIDLRTLSTFATRLFGRDHPVGLWIKQLDGSGRLQKAVFRIDRQGTAFAAQVDRLSLKNYRGLPGLQDVSGSIGGHGNVIKLDLDSNSGTIALPKVFDGPLLFDKAEGPIVFWIGRNYVGIRGENLSFANDESIIAGGFGISMPKEYPSEYRTTLIANAKKMVVPRAKEYVPIGLPQGLKSWLATSLQDVGSVSSIQLVYHGRNVARPGLPLRRVELLAEFESVSMDYHEDWPSVSDADGRLKVAAKEIRVDLRKATSFNTGITSADISIPSKGSYIDVNLEVMLPVARALLLAQETPIRHFIPVLSGDFVGEGSMGIGASLRVPLTDRVREAGNVKLELEFNNAAVSLNDLGVRIDALNGAVEYRSPHTVVKSDLSANLFGMPIDIEIISGSNAQEEFVGVGFSGHISASDLLKLIEVSDSKMATGIMEYSAKVSIFPGSSRPSELTFTSDLVGVDLNLPEEWAKSPSVARPLDVNIQFLDSYTSFAFRHGRTTGWVHLYDNRIRRGSVGVGAPAVVVSENEESVVVSGDLDSFEIDPNIADLNNVISWRLNDFRIDALRAGDLEFTNAVVSGGSFGGALEIHLFSDQVDATVIRKFGDPWVVDIDEIRIPRFSRVDHAEPFDPLSFDIIGKTFPADVTVRSVSVTDIDGSINDFGRWRFRLRSHPDGLRVLGLEGAIRGIEISSDQEMFWARSTNRTHFVGSIQGIALGSVLSQWGFDLSIEGESFRGDGDLTWPGSPLAFAVNKVDGAFNWEIGNGRFVNIEQGRGVARILGLLNYSTIARRLSGNFSDILSKGVSFNRIEARVKSQSGILGFTEPMFVEGNGLLFRVNGTVDLSDGRLDNELVITLPVSDSLPWYAAYIAIANPVAGVGVLLGRRIFGAQIENLSSGKYQISGTLNDPRVEFVSIFTNEMNTSSTLQTQVEKNLERSPPAR